MLARILGTKSRIGRTSKNKRTTDSDFFTGQSFWARGYYVSIVGRDEAIVRNYIKYQEEEGERVG